MAEGGLWNGFFATSYFCGDYIMYVDTCYAASATSVWIKKGCSGQQVDNSAWSYILFGFSGYQVTIHVVDFSILYNGWRLEYGHVCRVYELRTCMFAKMALHM